MGGTLKRIGPAPITDPDPVTIYDQGGIVLVTQFLEYLIDLEQRQLAQAEARRELDAERHARRLDLQASHRRHLQRRQPLRGRRVVTSMERVLDPEGGSGGATSQWGGVLSPKGTTAVDATTVEFHLDKPYRGLPVHGVGRQLQLRHPAAQLQW